MGWFQSKGAGKMNETKDCRLKDIDELLKKDYSLLRQLEESKRVEQHPRRIEELNKDIKRTQDDIKEHEDERDELLKKKAHEEKTNGALLRIWNVPHLQNPAFSGRTDILAELREALTSGAVKQVLWGMGGVGKSQIAIEYIYRHNADYSIFWWMGAEEPAALAAEFARLAGELDIPEKASTDQSVIVNAVKQHLGQLDGWLLVYDNAAAPEDIKNLLPMGGSGHVIITSRNPNWGGVAKTMKIKKFRHEESIGYLMERTQQDENKAASDLADELGDLPLALSEAASYMETTGTSMSEYLDLFRSVENSGKT